MGGRHAPTDNDSMTYVEPRYVVRFRPGSPEMLVVGFTTFFGACFAVVTALSFRFVDCAVEASSECTTPGRVQLLIAFAGVIPALGTLVHAIRRRGHPWRWFSVTALSYALWIVYSSEVLFD